MKRLLAGNCSCWLGHLCILLLCTSRLHAQPSGSAFRPIANDPGISITGQNAILQDSRGFIWFATWSGLYRYDGYDFKVYRHDPADSGSISSDLLDRLFEDRYGTLWILTHWDGLEKFDRITERFQHYGRRPGDTTALPLNGLQTILQTPDGTYWIGATSGLYTFDPATGSVTRFRHEHAHGRPPLVTNISIVYEDRAGTLWVGSWGGGLDRVDRNLGVIRHFQHDPSDPGSLSDNRVHSLCETADGMLWVGTWGGGLDRLDRGTNKFSHFRHTPGWSDGLSDNTIASLLQSSNGTLWVGTWSGGLSWSEGAGGVFHTSKAGPFQSHNFSSDDITSLYEDRSGILWIGSFRGIACLEPSRKQMIRQIARREGNDHRAAGFIYALLRDTRNRLWVGTSGGLICFDLKKKTSWHQRRLPGDASGPGDSWVTSFCEGDSGTTWVGSQGGIYRLDGEGHTLVHYKHEPGDSSSLSGNNVFAVCMDKAGTLWAGVDPWITPGVLDELDRSTGRFRHHRHIDGDPRSLSPGDVNAIIEDRAGILWIATGRGGVDEYDRRSGEFRHHSHDPGNSSSLSSNFIRNLLEDRRGGVLVRSYDGSIDRFNKDAGAFEHLTRNARLESELWDGIWEDQRGALWYVTNEGIIRLDPAAHTERAYGSPVSSSPNDALDLLHENLPAGGQFFMATPRGLISVCPDSAAENLYIPPVVINELKVFGRPFKLDSAIAGKHELTLPYTDNMISIDFAALDYTSPANNQYAYMLEGLEKEWVQSGTRHYATYTNLQPGSYLFRAKGSSSTGVWNEAGLSLRIVITPPFWRTWWFTALLWIVGLGSIGGTIRAFEIRTLRRGLRKLEQQQALERERVRISSDLHDELASNLTSIAMLSRIAQDEIARSIPMNPPPGARLLERITTLSRESVDSIRDIIWAIDPKTESLGGLLTRVRDMVHLVCNAKAISSVIAIPPEEQLPTRNLPPEFRQHLWFLLKEAINNAIKHSSCTELSFCVEYDGEELKILVRDNGRGFNPGNPTKGKGMATMRMRAEKLGARFDYVSAPEAGTALTVMLRMPVVSPDRTRRHLSKL